jgi:hypothetical protein
VTARDTAGALALDWITCLAVLPFNLRDRTHRGPRCKTMVTFEGQNVTTPLFCPHCGSRVA